jgi:septal ring factor EnvC (AmiA/AmiB activator)
MYMMKLRHGDRFGDAVGTSWRLLFVYALFPWIRKYRIGGKVHDTSRSRMDRDLSPKNDLCINQNEDSASLRDQLRKLKSEVEETERLRQQIKRMESEINHLQMHLNEAKTEAEV